jgi:TonB family protein
MSYTPIFTNHSYSASRLVTRLAAAAPSQEGDRNRKLRSPSSCNKPRVTMRGRRALDAARLALVSIQLPVEAPAQVQKTRTMVFLLAVPVFACVVWLLWGSRPAAPAEPENVYVFEDTPAETAPQARPDPSPPPPKPVPHQVPLETPSPQFGMQYEQLSNAGELAVATGNTLMTEADSIVQEPVEAMPAVPQLVDQAPRILKGNPPEYPSRALERGLEATVVVVITIDTLGRVNHVDVERSGGGLFDHDVVRAVKKLVFQPPVQGGKRLAARFRQPYEFKLQ